MPVQMRAQSCAVAGMCASPPYTLSTSDQAAKGSRLPADTSTPTGIGAMASNARCGSMRVLIYV